MAKHTLDLHDIFNKGTQVDRALDDAMNFCVDRRIPMLEIIPGKGSGQLKKKALVRSLRPALGTLEYPESDLGDAVGHEEHLRVVGEHGRPAYAKMVMGSTSSESQCMVG